MKKVFLIGDSIRMAYEPMVRDLLKDTCEVKAPAENCRFAAYVLNSLRFWDAPLREADVIHFNAGLWDLVRLYPEDGCFTPLDFYLATMVKIVRELKKTGSKLIFATTTPCDPRKAFLTTPFPPAIRNEDVRQYNEAACALMERENVPVNDLYAVIAQDVEGLISDDWIHPNEAGRTVLAEAVAGKIRDVMNG